MVYDFGSKYKTGDISDVDSYFKFLSEQRCDKLYMDAGLAREKFD